MYVLRGKTLKLGVSLAALAAASLAATTAAHAGAFAVREQSALYQGMSFAGSATGDELSSMFWNSAAAAAAPGINTETHVSIVVPDNNIASTGTSLLDIDPPQGLGLDTNSGNIGDATPVAASYANYQVSDQLYVGLAINPQYGFKTKPDNLDFAGTPIATSSEIFSLNFNPTVAYKITPNFTIGVGAQILYADVRLRSSNSTALVGDDGREVEVDDIAFGATAGISWQPAPGTTIGLGYRSRIEVDAEGTCSGTGLSNAALGGCGAGTDVTAELTLPDLVTASFRQQLNERIAVLGTVEWTNWSLVGEQAEFKSGGGTTEDIFPLGYDDGWFFALGLEYAYTPHTTLRGGIAYEISPISDEVRNVSLPDNDRIWLSVGASTKLSEKISVDISYTHIFVEDASIEIANPGGGNLLVAESESDLDIFTASFKYNLGGAEKELEPLK
jgi:long-chain fatty acid transport protein